MDIRAQYTPIPAYERDRYEAADVLNAGLLNSLSVALNRVAELEFALKAIVMTNPVADYVLDIHALEIRNIARAALKGQA